MNTFLQKITSELPDNGYSMDELLEGLHKNWNLDIIKSVDGKLISSDNPVTLYYLKKYGKISMITLPVNPDTLIVVYDKRKMAIKTHVAIVKDVTIMNEYIAATSIHSIFSSEKLDKTVQKQYDTLFTKRPKTRSSYDDISFTPENITYDKYPNRYFSFIEIS